MNDVALSFDVSAAPRTARAPIIVAVPANNEADRIEACLAALAAQRDRQGRPLPTGCFEILVFANNCSDDTAHIAAAMASVCVHPIIVLSETLPTESAHAGGARKRAMDIAADRLMDSGHGDGLILTTDADSVVAPTWIDATRRAITAGADCVAGYIDAHSSEIIRLGKAFIERGRLEDLYLSAVAEIYALCDPRSHDPWPNHRVSSGASLAVTLDAYLSIGGLPPKKVGEDAALTAALEKAGFRVRHSMDVCVSTSCRFDGRAKGGAADTIRMRHDALDSPCDDDLEPAIAVVRRALLKGRLRDRYSRGNVRNLNWVRDAGLGAADAEQILIRGLQGGFEEFWSLVVDASPKLRNRAVLRPSDLPNQIRRAALYLRLLRKAPHLKPATDGRVDIPDLARSRDPVVA